MDTLGTVIVSAIVITAAIGGCIVLHSKLQRRREVYALKTFSFAPEAP